MAGRTWPDGITPLITCEHAGNVVPAAYAGLFYGHETLLSSHRGWDPGALELARALAEAVAAPLLFNTTTRLLIDLNRSIGHPQLYSEISRPLSRPERDELVRRHYRPHRDRVERSVARIVAAGSAVLHIASHSFTPELDGTPRRADVAWLYDPRRAAERAFVRLWMGRLAERMPSLRLRRNYPYRGRNDGLTALLRRRYAAGTYIGIELEVNQQFVMSDGETWVALQHALAESLVLALSTSPGVRR